MALYVEGERETRYYGGRQQWLRRPTAVFGGCGTIAAANLLCCYVQKNPEQAEFFGIPGALGESIPQTEYMDLAERLYQQIGSWELPFFCRFYDKGMKKLPGVLKPSGGIGIWRFNHRLLQFSKKQGVLTETRNLITTYCRRQQAIDFIREGLQRCGAVVMLASWNAYPVTLETAGGIPLGNMTIKNHFVTICDMEENEKGIILTISTWGRVGKVNFDNLYQSWQSIKAVDTALTYLVASENRKNARRCRWKSPLLLLQSIFHGVTGGIFKLQ